MRKKIIISLLTIIVASCAEHIRQDGIKDVIETYDYTIDRGMEEWRNTHDTNCLIRLMPLVDSCIEFQNYCNRHDTLYAESYTYTDLKINILNSLKRYDEALSLIAQLPEEEYWVSYPFGKNYLLKTTLIRKYNSLKDYTIRDSIIDVLIEDMDYQFRANYGIHISSDTMYYGRGFMLVDSTDRDALTDYFIICIVRGDDKEKMINKVKQTFLTDEGNNKMYRECLIDWINNTDAEVFYIN